MAKHLKQCKGRCPKCNAEMQNIEYGDIEVSSAGVFQCAICLNCDCIFTEYYEYFGTEVINIDGVVTW